MIKGCIAATWLEVSLTEGDGGSVHWENDMYRMRLGVDCSWGSVFSLLLHESMEIAMLLNNHRLQRGNSVASSDYCFFMEHEQYTRVCEEAGFFVVDVLPQITAEYNEIHGLRGKKRVGVV